jgi:hypothetical protein|eukprot:COSAG06_NODE_1923_length_8061_cov_15.756091_10_plen_60_part_00
MKSEFFVFSPPLLSLWSRFSPQLAELVVGAVAAGAGRCGGEGEGTREMIKRRRKQRNIE